MINLLKHLSKLPKQRYFGSTVKFLARALNGEHIKSLNEGTLTGRFLMYFDQNQNYVQKIQTNYSLNIHPKAVKSYTNQDIISLLQSLDNDKYCSKYEVAQILDTVDAECCSRIKDIDIQDTLRLLHLFMKLVPHQMLSYKYFHLAIEALMTKARELNKDQLVHLIFFIGLLKKSIESQTMIRKCLTSLDKANIDNLTLEDLCIICNATFKTSTKIRNISLLNYIKSYINDNLHLLKDPAVFITLVKTLRHNRYQDEDILNTITCTIFFNKTIECYSFSAMCHILALYSDYLYYDDNVLKIFTKQCLELLEKSSFISKRAYLEDQPRTKDIKRFLWALSNLNYRLTKEEIEKVIIPQILMRVNAGEFQKDPVSLIQMILYLWMMQYKSYDLIRNHVNIEMVQFIKDNKLPDQDVNLLLYCIFHEDPEFFHSLKLNLGPKKRYNMEFQLKKRPVLLKIARHLQEMPVENSIDKYELHCQIPFINIIGITGYQKKIYKAVNVELLDKYTFLKNTDNKPTGLMQLKLRLLEEENEGLIVLEASDLENYNDSQWQPILKDEVLLVS